MQKQAAGRVTVPPTATCAFWLLCHLARSSAIIIRQSTQTKSVGRAHALTRWCPTPGHSAGLWRKSLSARCQSLSEYSACRVAVYKKSGTRHMLASSANEAVLDFSIHYLLTVLDRGRNAGFRFEIVATSAARACLYISYIGATKAAVHSAGCDQRRANHVCLC
jgi:hypothetical protein